MTGSGIVGWWGYCWNPFENGSTRVSSAEYRTKPAGVTVDCRVARNLCVVRREKRNISNLVSFWSSQPASHHHDSGKKCSCERNGIFSLPSRSPWPTMSICCRRRRIRVVSCLGQTWRIHFSTRANSEEFVINGLVFRIADSFVLFFCHSRPEKPVLQGSAFLLGSPFPVGCVVKNGQRQF